jgi:NADH:ubiquinone oxidoreductase subunit 2 (subunit N)
LAAGALVYALHTAVNDQRPLEISELSGLAWRYPLVAAALTLALLGLGGMPPLAGFMSKFQILLAGMATGQALIIGLVAFAAFNSLLSLTYYIPLVQVIFRREISPEILEGRPLPFTINLPLVLLALAILVIGIWPNLVFGLTNAAGAVVVGN